jgi:DNA (cytosine-5)-methyltransferase 1
MKPKKFFVDLFAGCGGLSLGLENVGFHPVFVNEINKDAMSSYLINREKKEPRLFNKNFHEYDIKKIVTTPKYINNLNNLFKKEFKLSIDNGELDLVVGGPPCQGFSNIGFRRSYSVNKDKLPSNHLYQDMAWVINKLQPKIFLFENVKGLLSAKWNPKGKKGEIFEDVLETFRSIKNYKVENALVLAKNYGAPQNRPRILIIGVRDDINLNPWLKINTKIANGFLPLPTYGAPDFIDLLGDLVDPNFKYGGSNFCYVNKAKTQIQKILRTDQNGVVSLKGSVLTEQEYSKHSDRVIERFKYMLKNNGEIPLHLKTKKFSQRLLPARWKDSGPNITATSLTDDYVHFSQARVLTVREWARLQGFPDWYKFSGSRTTGGIRRAGNPKKGIFERELPKYTQIGNAVPVYLAEKIGSHFLKII